MSDYELHLGDCLEVMPTLAKGSVAMVFADLPYGVTANKWDACIDLSAYWHHAGRVAVTTAAHCMTSTQPFTTTLVDSWRKGFKYDLVVQKGNITGFFRARYAPLRCHETVLVFCAAQPTYNPQMTAVNKTNSYRPNSVYRTTSRSENYGGKGVQPHRQDNGLRYPRSVLQVASVQRQKSMHPTQKPIALLEWLVATYTNPGDTVLDPCFGSGTTGVACANLGRRFIGIEKDAGYFATGKARIEKAYADAAAGPRQTSLAV